MSAISVRGLGKQYRRPVQDARAPGPFARLLGRGVHIETFWALRDLSFDVDEGDIVGFIGKNGAGKSTLLRILSRITKPTEGTVRLRGRVGTLLEVGTGFHGEMSGRENTYMNGAILGMSRREVRRKFDEIVAFAGVEDFIDMPVKRYSSGMYMRLAFAVAAHLDPDILIVDEVLAVGDTQFQKKCLEKVRQVSGEGRTVLFVSHNMETVQSLCSKAMLLEGGRGGELQKTADVVHEYLRLARGAEFNPLWQASPTGAAGRDGALLCRAAVTDDRGEPLVRYAQYHEAVWFEMGLRLDQETGSINAGMALYDDEERLIFQSFHLDEGAADTLKLPAGDVTLCVRVPVELLHPGQYRIKPLLMGRNQEPIVGASDEDPEVYFDLQGAISRSPHWVKRRPGNIAPRLQWRIAGNSERGQALEGSLRS